MGLVSAYLRGTDLRTDCTTRRARRGRCPRPRTSCRYSASYTASSITPDRRAPDRRRVGRREGARRRRLSLPLHVYRDAPGRTRPCQDGSPRRPSRAARSCHLPGRPDLLADGPPRRSTATATWQVPRGRRGHPARPAAPRARPSRARGRPAAVPVHARQAAAADAHRRRRRPRQGPQRGRPLGLSAVSRPPRARPVRRAGQARACATSTRPRRHRRPAGVLRLGEDASFGEQDRTKERIRAESRPHGILVIQGDAEYTRSRPSWTTPSSSSSAGSPPRRSRACSGSRRTCSARRPRDSMTYSNVEQESIEFVRYSLTPWLRRIELAISTTATSFERQYVKFELDGLLRADAKTRAEVYTAALDPLTGWMTREEVRRLEDLPPEPQGAPQVAQLLTRCRGRQPQMATEQGARTAHDRRRRQGHRHPRPDAARLRRGLRRESGDLGGFRERIAPAPSQASWTPTCGRC